jgi:hypothetical protein
MVMAIWIMVMIKNTVMMTRNRLCGLVVRVKAAGSEVPCSIPGARCPLSLVRIIEELFERTSSGSGLEILD